MGMTAKWSLVATAAAAAGVLYAGANALPSPAHAGDAASAGAVRVDNFRLTDANYKSHELYQLHDASAVVLITEAVGCAENRRTAKALEALKAAYAGKQVEFLMVNSTAGQTHDAVQTEAKALGLTFPVLLDSNQLVGEQLGVTRAGEVIILDPKTWKVIYRGGAGQKDASVAKAALDATLAGLPVTLAPAALQGCTIDFPNRTKPAQITYVHDVAPIIAQKCIMCHQPGGIGPVPFTSYEKVKAFSPMIREVIRTQRMPPWRADPTIGHFLDDKSLSPEQIKTLVHWVEAGKPRGEGEDPLTKVKLGVPDWPLGKPDVVLNVPAYTVAASGVVDYQHPWVANPATEGRWLRASTIKVENRQVVHHILTGYMSEVPAPAEQAVESRWGASVGNYAVGSESEISPEGAGTYLPAGGAIGFQDHYTPSGKEVTEHTQIGLYFYKQKPAKVMHGTVILNTNLSIPPNSGSVELHAYVTFPHDALLYSVFPHAHYRAVSSELWMQTPNGKRTLLVSLPKYDFNWQRFYDFVEPIKVPAGSKLIAYYTYDNSTRNPANPDPNRTVTWGEQSMDEMLFTGLRFQWAGETSDHPNTYDAEIKASRLFGALDQNMDGKIEKSELTGPVGARILAAFAMIDTNHDGGIDYKEMAAAEKMLRQRKGGSQIPAGAPAAKAAGF